MAAPLSSNLAPFGGADVYLSVRTARAGDLKGESTAPGHENSIILQGFSWGMEAGNAMGTTLATSRRSFKRLVVTKQIDASSTALMNVLSRNDAVKEATLSLRKPGSGQDDFFTIKLFNARVVGLDLDCNAAGEAVERVAFTFTKIEVSYRVQAGAGHLGATNSFSDELLDT